jgi:D-alanyl-D-alanine dipeptidase
MRYLAILSLLCLPAQAGTFDHLAEELSRNSSLTDVSSWPALELDVRYATSDNFTGKNVYGNYESCFLHVKAADMLKRALASLHQERPKWKLRVFDCLRPRRAQAILWNIVKGTPHERYVVSPSLGSVHNYGFAMDVSLSDENGHEVDMGTPFDFFGALAEPKFEDEMLKAGKLSRAQLANRRILRSAMKAGGFIPISNEWWHFDGLPGPEVRAKYKIVE